MAIKEEAIKYLNDAAPEQCFWVNNGPILKNMEGLAKALSEMGSETYQYHANREKNDFSKWVNDVIGDKKLANDLLSSRSKASALKKVRDRISYLKKKGG